MHVDERGRSGFARAELCASAKRQEDGCMGESMLPSNTDDGDCVGPQVPREEVADPIVCPPRLGGRSHCMSSSIGRSVQNSAVYLLVWNSPRSEGMLPAGNNRGNWNVTWFPADVWLGLCMYSLLRRSSPPVLSPCVSTRVFTLSIETGIEPPQL